jgi:hypothetical protein
VTGVSALAAIPSESGIKDKFSAQEMQSIFCSLFVRRDILICKLPNQDRWRKWTGPLEDHQILGVIADGGRGILRGCYWAEQTHHAVLDIDAGSKYHSVQELAKLREKLAAVGLTATPYRSSESGGWHLYIFLDDWANSDEVENSLKAWLKFHGYEIKSGTLEIFPSGNALRLPLQPGFAWLDQEGNVIRTREQTTREEALASFVSDLERNQRNWNEAKNRIESQLHAAAAAAGGYALAREERLDIGGLEKLFNGGKIQEIWEKGRQWWQDGLSERGERHDAVLAIGHYLWYGDEEHGVEALPGARHDAYRERLIEEWLTQKHNGYCRHIDQNKWEEIRAQIKRATAWRRDEKYKDRTPYPLTERLLKRLLAHYRKTGKVWTVSEYEQANIDRMTDARERIKAAILELDESREPLTISAIARKAGGSRNTVKRHRDLFAFWSGEYNRGGTGALSLSGGFCPGSEKEIFISVLDQADSGDLEPDRDLSSQDGSGSLEQLEQAASLGSAVAPPIPPQAAAPFRFGTVSAEQPCELAPIDLGCLLSCADRQVAKARESDGMEPAGSLASPSATQPSTGGKHWLSGSVSTCGLNGCLPSSAEPPLGPLHLNPRGIFSKGSGLVWLQDDGGTADSGQDAMISSQAGQVSETGPYPPVGLFSHSGINDSQVLSFGVFRYEVSYFDSACLQSCTDTFGIFRYGVMRDECSGIHVNSPQDKHLRVSVYIDVRGPPSVNSALKATSAH